MGSYARGGTQETVETYTDGSQNEPQMTLLADGGWVVVYSSLLIDGSSQGIAQQRFDANGNRVGAETTVNSFQPNIQLDSSVTALADGGWVVAWASWVPDGTLGIAMQRFDSAGNPVGPETQVNTFTTGEQSGVVLTALPDGGWVAAWHSYTSDGDSYGIAMQRFDSDGLAVGPETQVNTYVSYEQLWPTVTTLGDGGWLVSWTSSVQDGTGYGVYAQRFAANGATVGSEFLVNTTTVYDQNSTDVTGLADGGFVVTWQSYAQDDPGSYGVYMQRYDADGNTVGVETLVNTTVISAQYDPEITSLADGGWIIGWTSYEGRYVVHQQRFDANGNRVGNETDLSINQSDSQNDVSLIGLDDGSWTASWVSYDGLQYSVQQRHFALDIRGTAAADTLTGTHWDEAIFGFAGNDTLAGGAGDDILAGGAGNDTYLVNSIGDDVQEYTGQGYDTVKASTSFSIAADGAEALILLGTGDTNGAGNSADNALTGNNGANTLSGNGGNDVLKGGAGNDTLNGGNGNDVIFTGAGNDVADGGNGTDTANYSDSTAAITAWLALNIAQNTGGSGSDTLTSIENLIGSNFADTLTGNDLANMIEGGGGNDTLNGAVGVDTLSYASASAAITVSLALAGAQVTGGAGTDTISNFENILGSRFNDNLTGSTGANVIEGGAGNDTLNGGAGTDTVSYVSATGAITVSLAVAAAQNTGGAGTDTLAQFENMLGSAFNDNLTGSIGNNRIDAGAGADTLSGGDGNDVLVGGFGRDLLSGGIGADLFQFDDGHSGFIEFSGDVVVDFNQLEADRVDVRLIDADELTVGDQAFTFVGTAVFNGGIGQLRYEVVGANTLLQGDSDGDMVADFTIVLVGNIALTAADLLL